MDAIIWAIGIGCTVLIIAIVVVVPWRRDLRAHKQTVHAEIVGKVDSSHNFRNDRAVKFLTVNKELLRLLVPPSVYSDLHIGETGRLIYQGHHRFLSFDHEFPLQTVQAQMHSNRKDWNPATAIVSHFITFERISGERLELRTGDSLHVKLREGDQGLLTYRGGAFVDFKREKR